MPLETQYYEFDAEIERIGDEIQETAEQLAPLDADNPAVPQLQQVGQQLQSQLDGVRWAREAWDVDGVTLAGLTGGEYGHVEDEMGDDWGPGKARVYFVAKGTAEAPYIEEGMDLDERVEGVAALPIGYLRWADARIHELMSAGTGGEGNGNDFAASLQAARQQTSTES